MCVQTRQVLCPPKRAATTSSNERSAFVTRSTCSTMVRAAAVAVKRRGRSATAGLQRWTFRANAVRVADGFFRIA